MAREKLSDDSVGLNCIQLPEAGSRHRTRISDGSQTCAINSVPFPSGLLILIHRELILTDMRASSKDVAPEPAAILV